MLGANGSATIMAERKRLMMAGKYLPNRLAHLVAETAAANQQIAETLQQRITDFPAP